MDFYFIDERGNNSINFETFNEKSETVEKYKIASKYFQLGILKLNAKKLIEFQKYFNDVRYFLNLTKEFERIVGTKQFPRLWNIIQHSANIGSCSILTTHIEKEFYNGPYLYTKEYHKFIIFNIYRGLSYAMKVYKTANANKAQIIIDRFSMKSDNELNAIFYLKNKLSKYYGEIQIAFIDSRCSDYLQLIDVIIKVVGEKELDENRKFNSYDTDFIIRKDFT